MTARTDQTHPTRAAMPQPTASLPNPRPTVERAGPRRPPCPPSVGDVLTLQNRRGAPAVSVLLSTTSAPIMTPPDGARLDVLLRETERRLVREARHTPVEDLLGLLREQAAAARSGPTRAGVALFAGKSEDGRDLGEAYQLDVEVRDRVVLGDVYATRDLIRSLHRTPRHLVLLLTPNRARLFEGLGDELDEVLVGFPVRGPGAGAPQATQQWTAFAATVDHALGRYLADSPAPLVLAGDSRSLSTMLRCSRNLRRLAGTLPGTWHDTDTAQLVDQVRPLLLAYLRTRQLEALSLLTTREWEGRAVTGLQHIWTAARSAPVEMLAVEQDHFAPARISTDRTLIMGAQDLDAHGVLDDAVDEIIDMVLARGGWVALVDSGTLTAQGHMVLTLR